MNAFWIAVSIVQAVMLLGMVMMLPALYRREAQKEGR